MTTLPSPEVDQSQELQVYMENLGLIHSASGGIQADINVGQERQVLEARAEIQLYVDGALCDHNCRTKSDEGVEIGGYDCPAATSLHKGKGLSSKTFADKDKIIDGILNTADGIIQFNEYFLQNHFPQYISDFQIPEDVADIIRQSLSSETIEVNWFGGNPELHPDLPYMMERVISKGFTTNLTTTGGRFMRDENFLQQVIAYPPNLLALSADDFISTAHIIELEKLGFDELATRWKKIPQMFGQQKKAVEAIYTAKLAREYEGFPPILFNLVVHKGNLDHIEEVIYTLRGLFPGVVVNPFPAQSSFIPGDKEPVFLPEQLGKLENFVDNRIQEHIEFHPGVVPRVMYWLMIKAAFERYHEGAVGSEIFSGALWKCYEEPGAAMYSQIGASSKPHDGSKMAGGHPSCYWNGSITDHNQQSWDMNPDQISFYMENLGSFADQNVADGLEKEECEGCIMPRLAAFNMVSLELGMLPILKDPYLKLRKQFVGF